jgi:hypothetical protein
MINQCDIKHQHFMSIKDETNPRENRDYEPQSVLSFLHLADRLLWVDSCILVTANIGAY